MSSPRRILAVGLGPFNLGLAALAAPLKDVEVIVVEQRPDFQWHPGLLFDSATLQVPFLADLVTFADPTSPLSYVNYLKQHRRLYNFYIRESMYALRTEYNDYCRWVAAQLSIIRYRHTVTAARRHGSGLLVECDTDSGRVEIEADHLVVGTGTAPWLPDVLGAHPDRVLHGADFLHRRNDVDAASRVTIVGSGQSAAEVFGHLLQRGEHELSWLTRSSRFFAMETSHLTLELTSPDYLRHFSGLSDDVRRAKNSAEIPLYRGISAGTLGSLYDELYRRAAAGERLPLMLAGVAVTGVTAKSDSLSLTLVEGDTGTTAHHHTDLVVACTGYRHRQDPWFCALAKEVGCRDTADAHHCLDDAGLVYAQNTRHQPHGLTTHDLGMGPLRNSRILNAICGREVYVAEDSIAFQHFGLQGTMC